MSNEDPEEAKEPVVTGTEAVESKSRVAKLAERRQEKLNRKYLEEKVELDKRLDSILGKGPDQQNLVAEEPVKKNQKTPEKKARAKMVNTGSSKKVTTSRRKVEQLANFMAAPTIGKE